MLQAINKRVSRRRYSNVPIDHNKIELLTNTIQSINETSGLNIVFVEDGSSVFGLFHKSYGMFQGVRSIIVMKGYQKDFHLKEKIGYYGEYIVLQATQLGLGSCWVGATFDHNNPLLSIQENEDLICVITIGNVSQSKSIKENILYAITHRNVKPAEKRYEADCETPDWFRNGMDAVLKAPSALNSQKVFFSYKNNNVHIQIADDAPFDLVDLGIAKLHFEIATNRKFELGNNGTLI